MVWEREEWEGGEKEEDARGLPVSHLTSDEVRRKERSVQLRKLKSPAAKCRRETRKFILDKLGKKKATARPDICI